MRLLLCLLLLGLAGPLRAALTVMTWNVAGNGAADWSTNAPQIQAIGRILLHLRPDVVAFNEIPRTNTWEMANWVRAFLPGYYLATNAATDGFIRGAIASRYPITRQKSWLANSSLAPFGYTNTSTFTRDLYEAQLAVPGWTQPLHVFTTHLKAAVDADSSSRRAAEAGAISNFFVNGFLTTNGLHPYLLCGDLNEDVARPPGTSRQPFPRLANAATGLLLTTPTNALSGREVTFSARNSLSSRIDYLLPGPLLASNVVRSEVFRTGNLLPLPQGLSTTDDRTASDHLPVLMTFGNPFDPPFALRSLRADPAGPVLEWAASPGRIYSVQGSTNLKSWFTIASNLTASTTSYSWTGAPGGGWQFFRVHRGP